MWYNLLRIIKNKNLEVVQIKELANKIKDEQTRNNVLLALDSLPEYFWTIPASSTGKYHPSFSLGDGGLVRHTKFAVEVALELFNISDFTSEEEDCIISALLLHDGLKCGNNGKHTDKSHPILMREFLLELWKDWDYWQRCIIVNCIASHMGLFDEKGLLPKPSNEIEKFVHMCDYLASRKIYDKYYTKEGV